MLRLPAARSKLREASEIPLSDATAEVLRSLQPRDSGLVFPGGSGTKPLIEPAMRKSSLAVAAKRHGWPLFLGARFRDTFQTWAEATGQNERAIDLLVGHNIKTTTRRQHYSTFSPVEETRRLANKWAAAIEVERKKTSRRKR